MRALGKSVAPAQPGGLGDLEEVAARLRVALPPELDRRFEAIVFDWDGTAVPDRAADASRVRERVERLCSLGMHIGVVSGTHLDNVDGQLRARPSGPGRLYLLLNRGSEVFEVSAEGPRLVCRREANPAEERALTEAAEVAVALFGERGLQVEIVSQRLNRRKIDLIPVPEWADPPKARIDELLQAVEERLRKHGLNGLKEAAELGLAAAKRAGLQDARVTSDAKHVEIGLTDKSHSATWMLRELWKIGIGPGLVLIAGDEMGPQGNLAGSDSLMLVPEAERATAFSVGVEPGGVPEGVVHLGGGPAAFSTVLDDQIERRLRRDVPLIDESLAWTITVEGFDPELARVHDQQLSFANGELGTSGSPLQNHTAIVPLVAASGVFTGSGPQTKLLPGPLWNRTGGKVRRGDQLRRTIDLRSGVLRQELITGAGTFEGLGFLSLKRPEVAALRVSGPPNLIEFGEVLKAPRGATRVGTGVSAGGSWLRVLSNGDEGGVACLAAETRTEGDRHSLERIAAFRSDPIRPPAPDAAAPTLAEAQESGFEALLSEHRESWASRWDAADIVIEGDDELQRGLRFALFHLMGSAAARGESTVGARNLTGTAYRGHVFWDTEVFVLPFLAATHPTLARSVLEYRVRRLPQALRNAEAIGRRGARFPWESARDGTDVTPRVVKDRFGRRIRIQNGELEEHIVADVAWGCSLYMDWTGDEDFMAGPGGDIIVETARYWASRIRLDSDGRAHIYGVIGPDEYHGPVDDNAFTNVMARWNLRKAVEIAERFGKPVEDSEITSWESLASNIVDGFDHRRKLYEQFAGFFDLEPLIIANIAPRRPIAADVWLGPERVKASQVIKQADVLMLHHMVPDQVVPGSLRSNLKFYEMRTAHGSSLSPGIHASLFARDGRFEEAQEFLKVTSLIDLDDLTGTTAGGLHLATMGSLWQALVTGFAGVRPDREILRIDPKLPRQWKALRVPVRFRGNQVRIDIEPQSVTVYPTAPLKVRIGSSSPQRVNPPSRRFTLDMLSRKA